MPALGDGLVRLLLIGLQEGLEGGAAMNLSELKSCDVKWVLSKLPKDVFELLKDHPGRLFLGGGFIRDVITGSKPNDIDLLGRENLLEGLASSFCASRVGAGQAVRKVKTKNAVTIITPPRLTVQFITRWTYDTPAEVCLSFDYTMAMAVLFYDGVAWQSYCHKDYYADLAARRLVYTAPVRHEDAGGSMLRMRKFLSRGWNIQMESMAAVISRLCSGVDWESKRAMGEHERTLILAGLLREVDPSILFEGMPPEDHEILEDSHEG